jgi:hypothetical protein
VNITAVFGVEQFDAVIKPQSLSINVGAQSSASGASAVDEHSDGNVRLLGVVTAVQGAGDVQIVNGISATEVGGNITLIGGDSPQPVTDEGLSISAKAQGLGADINNRKLTLNINPPVARQITGDIYDGDYRIDPSQETVVLSTLGKAMIDNVVINPIPSNYGLITWNGSTLTVS